MSTIEPIAATEVYGLRDFDRWAYPLTWETGGKTTTVCYATPQLRAAAADTLLMVGVSSTLGAFRPIDWTAR